METERLKEGLVVEVLELVELRTPTRDISAIAENARRVGAILTTITPEDVVSISRPSGCDGAWFHP